MSIASESGQDSRPGHAAATPTADSSPRSDDRPAEPVDRRERIRRARQRARARQAVSARRPPILRWTESSDRLLAGLALLTVIGIVVWVEIVLMREPDDPAAGASGPSASARGTSSTADAPTPRSEPTAEPPIPAGPDVGVAMIEANGPIDGCSFYPRLAELRAKIGATLVGDCVDEARPDGNSDVRQRTTRGELVWTEADSRAAFTDGEHSWITTPAGTVRRRNYERFAWERDAEAGPRPASTTHVLPPPLPGAVLPARRVVTYYGNPLSSGMGVLGELPPEKLFPRLRTQADGYKKADAARPVLPALQLVAVVAQQQPGPDGLYRLRMETSLIERVAGWAEEHGFLLILDVQVGRGNVDDEVRWLLPFLERPHVHLALDPEFAMPAGQVPGQRIGTMDAAAINRVQKQLADLVETRALPPKLLLVHRFTEGMVTRYSQIATDPRVQVVMVMDGFGVPSIKARQYDELIAQQRVQYTGFKLFYRHDDPLMTPEQVILLEPAPDLIIYQ
jgi:hypothetical protein